LSFFPLRRSKELDVIDLFAMQSSNAVGCKLKSNGACRARQLIEIRKR
jgi:hypothetical protein